jgi:hypothetical protein
MTRPWRRGPQSLDRSAAFQRWNPGIESFQISRDQKGVLLVPADCLWGNGGCYDQHMAKPRKKELALVINTFVWLRDEQRFTILENLDHTPRPGEELKVDGELWRVVEWTDRIECQRVVN